MVKGTRMYAPYLCSLVCTIMVYNYSIMERENCVNPEGKKLLKDVRKDLGLTQDAMAELLGVKRQRITEIETGRRIPDWLPRAITLQKLLKEAGYSLEDLAIPDDN